MPYPTMMIDATKNENDMQNMGILGAPTQIPRITTSRVDNNHNINNPLIERDIDISMNNGHLMNAKLNQLQPPHQQEIRRPTIEIATYAETEVFECYIRGAESHIIMRKLKDDWVNVTQIFKIAKFSKNQRTKILEKESSTIPHEKVQGGYGRFQGTWIPLDNARILVEKYKIVDPVVNTILNFVFDPNSPPPRRTKNSVLRKTSPGKKISSPSSYNKTTPKRRPQYDNPSQYINNGLSNTNNKKAKRANRKNSISNPSPLQNVAFQTPQQSFLSGHSATTINGSSFGNTATSELKGNQSFNVSTSGNSTISHLTSDETPQTNGYSASQKPLQFYPVPTSLGQQHHNNAPNNGANEISRMNSINNRSQRKFSKKKAPTSTFLTFVSDGPNSNYPEFSMQQYDPNQVDTVNDIAPQSNQHSGDNESSVKREITQQFQDEMNQDNVQISDDDYKNVILQTLSSDVNFNDKSYSLPMELYYPPQNFGIDFLIDEQGHTSLHWAAAMANIPLIQLLLNSNANALHCNSRGFNAVTKALFYNNNYKSQSFHDLLSVLKICLVTPDNNGRLPLHYLVELSVNKSKDPAIINSYTESLLQVLSSEGNTLLEMSLNYQDNVGNTPLHLAALNLNISLFNKLCLLGASTGILNMDKHSPVDILSSYNMIIPSHQKMQSETEPQPHQQEVLKPPSQKIPKRKYKKKSNSQNIEHLTQDEQQVLSIPELEKKTDLTEDPTNSSLNLISVEDISSVDMFVNPALSAPISSTITKNYNKNNLLSPNGALTPSKVPLINSPLSVVHTVPSMPDFRNHGDHSDATVTKADRPNKMSKFVFLTSPHFAALSENSRHFVNLVSEDDISRNTQARLTEITNLTGVRKMAHDLNNMVGLVTSRVEEEVGAVIGQVSRVENELELNKNQKLSVDKQVKDLCNDMEVQNIKEIGTNLNEQQEELEEKQVQLEKMMEQCQALKLAKMMHEEESFEEDQELDPTEESDKLKQATLLTLLQFSRRLKLKQIRDRMSDTTTTDKITKYKQLIGMSSDGIEDKLDQIEQDLAVNV